MTSPRWKFWEKAPVVKLPKSVVFIDGDQNLAQLKRALPFVGKGPHVSWITSGTVPNYVKKHNIKFVCLSSVSSHGKETSDKYIGIAIQQAVSSGITNITVVSSDYDFVDIFKMVSMLNLTVQLNFTLVAPAAKGRLVDHPSTDTITIMKL